MLVRFITIDICFAYEIEQPITAISRYLINLTTSIRAESLVAVKAIKAFRRINQIFNAILSIPPNYAKDVDYASVHNTGGHHPDIELSKFFHNGRKPPSINCRHP